MSQAGVATTGGVLPSDIITSITGNTGGPVGPDGANNINVIGSGNINVAGNAGTFTETITLVGTTNHAIQIGNALGSLTSIAVGLNGQVPIGATGADPAFGTITSPDSSITFTTGANSLAMTVTGGSTVGKTITGNLGGPLSPTLGNWNLLGSTVLAGSTPFYTVGLGSTMTFNIQRSQAIASTDSTKVGLAAFNSANFTVDANGFVSSTAIDLHTARYIVSAGGTTDGANYTTIASAYAAAVAAAAPQTVFIQPGTYTENITLTPGINLAAYDCDAQTPNVTISGNLTLSAAGTVSISGIRLQTNNAAFLTVSGSAASRVIVKNCYLNCLNATGVSYSSSDSSSLIHFNECEGNIGTTGIALFASTSTGALTFNYTMITNSGASTTPSTSSAGNPGFFFSYIANPVTTSATSSFGCSHTEFDIFAANTTCLIHGGSGTSAMEFSKFGSGTASAISISGGATGNMYHCVINSSNTNAITGAGTLNYANLTFYSSAKINTTTQTGGVAYGGLTQAPSVGFIGQQITANATGVSVSDATGTNVATIALTPGIWDVTGMADFSSGGAVTGTSFRLGINNTSATMPGGAGTNQLSTPTSPNAASNSGLCICPQRVTITANTNYYLVCQANFTVGTVAVSGIITATRVG